MNLPNKLTILRIIFVPFFMFFLLFTPLKGRLYFSLLIFLLASFTDFLDGKIARKKNLITDFGKFADPLADKILVMSAFISFIELGWTNSVVAMIILAREFAVTSLRLVASTKGQVISANIWGKAKTVSQMAAIAFLILTKLIKESLSLSNIFFLDISAQALIYISVILTLISGIIYIKDNKNIISSK